MGSTTPILDHFSPPLSVHTCAPCLASFPPRFSLLPPPTTPSLAPTHPLRPPHLSTRPPCAASASPQTLPPLLFVPRRHCAATLPPRQFPPFAAVPGPPPLLSLRLPHLSCLLRTDTRSQHLLSPSLLLSPRRLSATAALLCPLSALYAAPGTSPRPSPLAPTPLNPLSACGAFARFKN